MDSVDYEYHQNTATFNYTPASNVIEVEYTLIIDYLGYQKMIIQDVDGDFPLFKITQEAHYNRNQYNFVEDYGTITVEELSEIPNINLKAELEAYGFSDKDTSAYFHNLLLPEGSNTRTKYLKEIEYISIEDGLSYTGRSEAILYKDVNDEYQLDTSPLRMGTFNFALYEQDELHRIKDVYPYLVWGNNQEDFESHNVYERFIWDVGSKIDSKKDEFRVNEQDGLLSLYEENGEDQIPYFLFSLEIDFFDNQAPVIVLIPHLLYIEEGAYSDLDWSLRVGAYDNYTAEELIVKEEVLDTVDYNTDGEYSIKVKATDLAGNEIEMTLLVTVLPQISGC